MIILHFLAGQNSSKNNSHWLKSIGRINALSPKAHAHRAIVATVFHPDHTEILPESTSLVWKFPLFYPFPRQFMPPGQPTPCCIYAMQQHWHGLSGNASLNQPNRPDCCTQVISLKPSSFSHHSWPMRISMRVVIAATMVLTGWFAWANPFWCFIIDC